MLGFANIYLVTIHRLLNRNGLYGLKKEKKEFEAKFLATNPHIKLLVHTQLALPDINFSMPLKSSILLFGDFGKGKLPKEGGGIPEDGSSSRFRIVISKAGSQLLWLATKVKMASYSEFENGMRDFSL